MIPSIEVLPDSALSATSDDDAGFGSLSTEKGVLPLKAMSVQTRIDGLVAHTVLRQTYVNNLGTPLEATYIFPLPDRAAVTRFRMEVAGRIVEGVLKERGEARQEYDQALQDGKRAAIAEEERPGVFTMRVGNLMPGEEAVVQLTFTGPLTFCDGEATYRFPLVVAPRYIPGTPLEGGSVGAGVAADTDAVPDASRITPPVLLPGFPSPVRLALGAELHPAGLTISAVRSSLHAVDEETMQDCRRIRVTPGERLDRDFILRFRVGEKSVQTSLALQPDADGKEGTFLLTLIPPTDNTLGKPRDAVFILDRSGSMAGWKMVAARRALARMVDTLTDRDRFTVYAFDDRIETPAWKTNDGLESRSHEHGLVPASDRNRFRAVEFLARIESRGGTEMGQPLDRAVTQLAAADPQRDRILVLVTDGQVGNEDQILRTLGARLQEMRIFTLGIDRAVNEGFLKRLACLGGGCSELVESEDRLDEVMDRVHRRIGAPVLTGLRLEAAGLRIDEAAFVPGRLPDLFAGTPLVLAGRYSGAANGSINVLARDAADRPWTQNCAGRSSDNPSLSWTWARGRVRELEDRYAGGRGDLAALEKEIVRTSLQFGVLCRFTAFVAVDVKEIVNPGGQVQRITQPVEAASGWAMLGTDKSAGCEVATFGKLRKRVSMNSRACYSFAAHPPAPAPSSESTFGRVKQFLLGSVFDEKSVSTDKPASPPANLTAYRRCAAEMLQRLQAGAGRDHLMELGILAVQLTALVEDLRTIGAAEAEVQPLTELLALLNQQLTAATTQSEPLWSKAEAVLRAFSEETQPAVAGKRTGFWK